MFSERFSEIRAYFSVKQVISLAYDNPKNFREWFVVRNRTNSEVERGIGPVERFEREEKFFDTETWKKLREKGCTGTKALKDYLANLLSKRIKASFPTYLTEIQRLQTSTQLDLLSLGTARKTLVQKRSYLTGLATNINDLASPGLRGRYESMTTNGMKLRKIVRDDNDRFALSMKNYGHSVPFASPPLGLWGKQLSSQTAGFGKAVEDPKPTVSGSGSLFGGGSFANATPEKVGPSCPGTASLPSFPHIPFSEPNEKPIGQSISFKAPYNKFSFEELRLSDTLQTTSTSSTPNKGATAGSTAFGSTSTTNPQPSNSVFGASSQPNGGSSGGGFGGFGSSHPTSSTPKQGAAAGSTGFGNTSTTNPQSSTSVFGAPTQSKGGLFGGGSGQNPTGTSGVFGSSQSTSSTTNKGVAADPTSFGSTSVFGGPRGGFGQKPTGLFSNAAHSEQTPTTNLFSSSGQSNLKPPNLFGNNGPQNQTSGNGVTGKSRQPNQTSTSVLSGNSLFDRPVAQFFFALDIYQWIRDVIKASRGTELQGTLNPDVLPTLFHDQARKWREIAERHFLTVSDTVFNALTQILDLVCKDSLTRTRIQGLMYEANEESKKQGLAKLCSRMDDILSRHLQTSNPAFEQKVSEARRMRFHAALERFKLSKSSSTTNPAPGNGTAAGGTPQEDVLTINMRDTESLFKELHFSNARNLEDEIHDTLKAYYEIAREDFVGYVNDHIVEEFLYDPRGPVLFFSPLYVAGLDDEKIEELAVENDELVEKRERCEEALARLGRAEEIARRFKS